MARGKLQSSLHAYSCVDDPTKLCILEIRRDLEHHQDFLASQRKTIGVSDPKRTHSSFCGNSI